MWPKEVRKGESGLLFDHCVNAIAAAAILSVTNGEKLLYLWIILHLKSTNPQNPVEDFGKVYHRGRVNFQMHLPSVCFWNKVYHRGSKYFIKKYQMSLSSWNSHSHCVRYFWNLPHRVCGIKRNSPFGLKRCKSLSPCIYYRVTNMRLI